MTIFYVGDRVEFFAQWSTWRGLHGEVKTAHPGLWVLIDGDTHPVAVSDREIIHEPSTRHLGGAE